MAAVAARRRRRTRREEGDNSTVFDERGIRQRFFILEEILKKSFAPFDAKFRGGLKVPPVRPPAFYSLGSVVAGSIDLFLLLRP